MSKLLVIFALFFPTTGLFASTFNIDTAHSMVGFKIKHLVISTVTGRFNQFEGQYDFDEKTGKLENVSIEIQTASIDTNEPDRDKHLKSPDFFDVEKKENSTITFKTTKVEYKNKKPIKMTGEFKMHGVTKPLTLDVTYNGSITDPWGNERNAFLASGKIKRKDFGLTWNKTLDKGGVMIGEDVDLVIEIEGKVKKQEVKK